uniref:RAP domain-containing protein n=1 Tax=Chromera velia CCMP2878 TaxID=1169474 RepID=A0A0G4FFB4_9ALVE|eukprot:Cvel_16683.t1-p1 / transcript=Cvel_16683.t1 / gene=Cvel_16683 / organism=Chromera_velia_CCMP2878 / gene_product=hypothetical protein / transcript_product=hypothetical protein / location=Cvel_scaffold1295:14620-15039(+) / protein_length=140 / sequence_SO=supercontig / SO=protein_coding / is_pseudo=false
MRNLKGPRGVVKDEKPLLGGSTSDAPRSFFFIDMGDVEKKKGVEVNGPFHFLRTPEGIWTEDRTGSTQCKARLLRALGWDVVEATVREVEDLRDKKAGQNQTNSNDSKILDSRNLTYTVTNMEALQQQERITKRGDELTA